MPPRRDPVITGVFLIVLGLGLFALQNAVLDEAVVFFVIGGAFVAAYLLQRVYGFLIPGCIMLGLGLGTIADHGSWPVAEPIPFGLGLGFLAIYLIDRAYTHSSNAWPLFPAVPLVALGVMPDPDSIQWFFRRGWPLMIVIIGILVLVRGLVGRGGTGTGTVTDA